MLTKQSYTAGWTANSGSYGWLLPDVDLLLLSGEALDGLKADGGLELATSRSFDTLGNNPFRLIDGLRRSGNQVK